MDHWKQQDKGRQQQQLQQQQKQPQQHLQHNHQFQRNQSSKTTSDHNSTKQHTDPIQSIAQVLNHHSKFVQHQKKSQQLEEEDKNKLDQIKSFATGGGHNLQQQQQKKKQKGSSSASQDRSSSPFACSHNFNQVDQGNSYLYAYNDFVTSKRGIGKDLEPARSSRELTETQETLCNHNTSSLKLAEFIDRQESVIESDEDDALNYILHQHRPHFEQLHDIRCLNSGNNLHDYHIAGSSNYPQYEESISSFDAQRIDHHLSCSRSSHPRHICGLGGSHNDRLNHIAARLREESQRAFILNQKPRINYSDNTTRQHINNDIASIQARQLNHDLNIIHDQLAHIQSDGNQLNKPNRATPKVGYLNINNELHLISGAENPAFDRQELLITSSESKGSSGDLANESTLSEHRPLPLGQLPTNGCGKSRRNSGPGFLSWLFYCICSLVPGSSCSQQAPVSQNLTNVKQRRHKNRAKRTNESSSLSMYTSSHQVGGVGQLGGQAGAYYATQASQADAMHQSYANHAHHHHYPLSSDSSLGSSAFANSAIRVNAFFRNCCSKKCLFVFCLMLILLIFIFVMSLSAYLNFLINSNKTNLTPLSGRLKVDTQGDSFNEQLSNRTSKEFLAKQQQYETILRGAFDRTQDLLKSYPSHLVKCEVYSFKAGSLWVYFRLFINKKTLMQDGQLMKRKSPDENMDKQFLPRLTQQTLHSGFEQLVNTLNRDLVDRRSRSSQNGDARQPRAVVESKVMSAQRDHVRSFDDQISLLMPIIESIDLQSIQVTPEFDMLQGTNANLALQQQSISDNLRASQFLTTTSSAVMVATGSNNKAEYDVGPTSTESASSASIGPTQTNRQQVTETEISRTGSPDEVSVSTKKFTLIGYKENTTRPTTSSRPVLTRLQAQQESPFLVNQQKKPTITNGQSIERPNGFAEVVHPQQSNDTRNNHLQRLVIDSQASNSREKIIKLVSGQPVIIQNNQQRDDATSTRGNDEKSILNSANKNITLFSSLPKTNQPPNSPVRSSDKVSDSRTGVPRDNKLVNETLVIPMVAPYQKIEYSSPSQTSADGSNSARRYQDTSIQELWNNALNGNKKNATPKADKPAAEQFPQPKRLLTITTIGGKNQDLSNTSSLAISDWHKLSEPNPGIANRMPTQLNVSSTSTPPSPPASVLSATSTQKPKVSPHLKQGGSLISIQPKQQESPSSAVVLNRDFQQVNNEGQLVSSTNSSSARQLSSTRLSQTRSDKQPRKPHSSQRNSTSTAAADFQKLRATKPATIKQQKVKKVTDPLRQQSSRNDTTTGSMINNSVNRTSDTLFITTDPSIYRSEPISEQNPGSINSRHNRNKTKEAFNFNADHMTPTLPTTIELTRSTSAAPGSRTTPSIQISDGLSDQRTASSVDYTTTSSATQRSAATTTESPMRVSLAVQSSTNQTRANTFAAVDTGDGSSLSAAVINLQSTRPGTSSFSNQWKPISINNGSSLSISESRGATKKPSLALIIGTERLAMTVNVPSNQGSQSPFAMSPAILENQLKPTGNRTFSLQSGSRRLNKLSNAYQVVGGGRSDTEFESHRMSRIWNGESPTMSTSSTSTPTSLLVDLNTRVVDDFMITTDRMEDSSRSTTMLPSIVTSASLDPLPKFRPPSDQPPKRTRGPFAFETLRSISVADAGEAILEGTPSEISSSRSERSPVRIQTNSKLLVRKKLFLGAEDGDELIAAATEHPSVVSEIPITSRVLTLPEEQNITPSLAADSQFDRFGNRKLMTTYGQLRKQQVDQRASNSDLIASNQTLRCTYYGCMSKGSSRFICLNYTQICDDFIDCQDESDELDCVSLLKHDGRSNKLSFSNGGGIIYLNRKGSLAPMCIDHFGETGNSQGIGLPSDSTPEASKKYQELIKQINTIGHYACNLQSFSKLVSVKINHHDLVDTMGLIKASKLYHRLSIISESDKRDKSLDSSMGSYKSGNSEHEVEVSTSLHCPSQKTVFVKCGGFECGQDTFSALDPNNSARKRGEVTINDFPWLVKLFWLGSLSCHGYLIDELWLISSNECFVNKLPSNEDKVGWSAEISYEHYGNDDYQSIESNRRNIKEILTQPYNLSNSGGPSIVLAKLEKPVRFSPLNRPICLPASAANKTFEAELDRTYRDCVTATLPLVGSAPTQDLILSRVKALNPIECIKGEAKETLDDLICVDEIAKDDVGSRWREGDATRVLICSTQAPRSRSRWTVVGVQLKTSGLQLEANKQLFTRVSSQLDWIVDTMNPKSYQSLYIDGNSLSGNENTATNGLMSSQNQTCNQFKCSSGECLSWSRICDGLYDCSSHDDEKDCHK